MSISLQELSDLVKSALGARGMDGDVAGVSPSEGDGCYAEVLLSLSKGSQSRRLSIGLPREAPISELRDRIAQQLDAEVRR